MEKCAKLMTDDSAAEDFDLCKRALRQCATNDGDGDGANKHDDTCCNNAQVAQCDYGMEAMSVERLRLKRLAYVVSLTSRQPNT